MCESILCALCTWRTLVQEFDKKEAFFEPRFDSVGSSQVPQESVVWGPRLKIQKRETLGPG